MFQKSTLHPHHCSTPPTMVGTCKHSSCWYYLSLSSMNSCTWKMLNKSNKAEGWDVFVIHRNSMGTRNYHYPCGDQGLFSPTYMELSNLFSEFRSCKNLHYEYYILIGVLVSGWPGGKFYHDLPQHIHIALLLRK